MTNFTHTVTDQGDHVLLVLAGDLDFAAHGTLATQISTLLAVGRGVVVDCSGVTFLDSMGLRALIEGAHGGRRGPRLRAGRAVPAGAAGAGAVRHRGAVPDPGPAGLSDGTAPGPARGWDATSGDRTADGRQG
ncbi:STAS domain-containing protein [Catenulispora yoronensis]